MRSKRIQLIEIEIDEPKVSPARALFKARKKHPMSCCAIDVDPLQLSLAYTKGCIFRYLLWVLNRNEGSVIAKSSLDSIMNPHSLIAPFGFFQ